MAETTNSPVLKSGPFLLIAAMFVTSGASALIYEVVWTRQLTTFFGSTLYGVATVLAAFMGGLALGSFLIGRYADRFRKPLAVYGYFEIAIALAALAFPFALRATQPIIGSVYASGGEGTFYTYSLIRFVLVFILLIVPTSMMGATLPILSRAVTESMKIVGTRVGALYALNTLGALTGVFLAGFFLLAKFGVWHTTLIAVAGNLVIGVAAIIVGQRMFTVDVEAKEPVVEKSTNDGPILTPLQLRVVLGTYAISGFLALAYQVVWTRSLIFSFDHLKSTTYSFSAMLVVFLAGLTIGSAVMQAFVDKQRQLLRLYAIIQCALGIFGVFSFFRLINGIAPFVEINDDGSLKYWNAVGNVMLQTAVTIGVPTILMGMAFPVVMRLVASSVTRLGYDVARVYALNTLGAIFGSFAAGFILIPTLGLSTTLALLAGCNLLLGALLFWLNTDLIPRERQGFAIAAAALAVLLPLRIIWGENYLQPLQPNERFVFYEEGAMATVTVVENPSQDRMIYVDGVGVAGTDKIMLTDQKTLAHIPMMLLGGEAKRTLSVGFGSGGASFSYTLYDNIEEIHTIEIAPEVLRAAPTLTDSNHGIIIPERDLLSIQAQGYDRIEGFHRPLAEYVHTPVPGHRTFDPRFKVIIDDARSYLRFSKDKYDVIATDCTDLRYKTNANLYDLEYFQLCHDAISDRGLVVVWMPLAGLSDSAFRSALRTFQVVFPEMSVWYFTNQPTHYCLLIGGKSRLEIDFEAVSRAVQIPGVAEDLEEIALADPEKLISSFVCDERTLTDLLKDYPLNTEDFPYIEFESPRFGYDSRPLRDNQWRLYDVQTPVSDLVVNLPEGARERLWQLQEANFISFQGHSAYREYDFVEAAKLYQKAQEIAPFDDSIQRLLNFDELRTLVDKTRDNPSINTLWIAHSLAAVYLEQDRFEDAVTAAAPFADFVNRIDRFSFPDVAEFQRVAVALNRIVSEAYERAGRPRQATQYRESAERFGSS